MQTSVFLARAVGGAAALVALTLGAQAQTLGCSTGGASGAIPTSGSGGGGVYPGSLPPSEMISNLNVASIPPGAVSVTEVKLNGLTHTWIGDVQFVLEDPAGAKHNLWVRPSGSCDFSGDYVVAPLGTAPAVPTCSVLTPGTYQQFFGTWPSGTNGIFNTDLSAVVPQTGTWKLIAYDWAGGDLGFLNSWDLCFGAPPPPPTPNCLASFGAGGAIPTAGTGDGTWDTVLPSSPVTSTVNVTVPAGATKIVAVYLNGLSHTWAGDLQATLTTPAGAEHNLFCRPGLVPGTTCCGNSADFGGDYVIQQVGPNDFEAGVAAGTYSQHFGQWTGGNLGILNTALESIPISSGNYTLRIYDWAAGDVGSLTNWEFCFDTTGPGVPVAYCTGGTSTSGCVASIAANVQPNVGNNAGCVITTSNVEGQKLGLHFYGINNTGFTPVQWGPGSTSFQCVKGPTNRMNSQNSGGTLSQCDGSLTNDWDLFQANNPGSLGNPWSAGDKVFVQAWYRDPTAVKTTNLSNAIEMTIAP